MDLVLATAKVWHFWIAPAVLALTVIVVVATIIGYLVKVVGPKYPKS